MDIHEEESAPLSKTRRKKAMDELQTLGEELVALPADRVKKIAIPDDLRDAVAEAQRMKRHDEARRRQMQYIGKLMRKVDAEPIRAALADVRGESAGETAKLHRIERLRTDLLADEKVLNGLAERYPAVDLQHLRSLRRAALKEQEQNRPPRSYRAIFQVLKSLENEGSSGHEPGDEASEESTGESAG
ncbi:ribosome biogenesis factor YjgA [Propionivibrio soli]|uniref:ribosome biogenesis factor YjgA n=1 Tax=Propionivibrio soli TaxID=2976531 RepID=UPI0021E99961|nr:ribosome biogenesis factor YjgA [Propionivibrio soli]